MTLSGRTAADGVTAVEAALRAMASTDWATLAPPNPLPAGALDLIRVAAEDRTLADELARRHGTEARRIEDAALHFVHAVMFHPDSDHFRVLGVRPDVDEETLKLHFRWLQKWLHPDRDPDGWSSAYAERVNVAWAQLRRAERRAEYRERLREDWRPGGAVPTSGPVATVVDHPPEYGRSPGPLISSRWARRLPAIVVGGIVAFMIALLAAHRAGENLIAEERARSAAPHRHLAATDGRHGIIDRDAMAGVPSLASPASGAIGRAGESAPVEGFDATETGAPGGPRTDPKAAVSEAETSDPVRDGSTGLVVAAPAPDASKASVTPVEATEPRPTTRSAAASARQGATHLPQPSVGAIIAGADAPEAPARPPVRPAPAERSPSDHRGTEPPNSSDVDRVAPALVAAATRPEPAAAVIEHGAESLPVSVKDARPWEPTADQVTVDAAPVTTEAVDPAVGRRLLNRFSAAYREGRVQEVVILFLPNAMTPAGNLLDLHREYGAVFADSSRRSLEFVDVEWRAVPNGLEGVGRYEWAMRARGQSTTRSTSGRMRVIIEVVDGRALIARLDQQDVG